MSKPAVRDSKKKNPNGSRSGRYSTREVYRPPAAQPAKTSTRAARRKLKLLPPVLKDQRGMATDYSCRLAASNIARIKLTRRSEAHFWIDWVFVPPAYRDYGLGRRLMRDVLEDADDLGVRLSLEARACAGVSQEKLEAWYGSMGFEKTPFRGEFGPIMVRMPQVRILRQRQRKAA